MQVYAAKLQKKKMGLQTGNPQDRKFWLDMISIRIYIFCEWSKGKPFY